jgi:hypothetical protein
MRSGGDPELAAHALRHMAQMVPGPSEGLPGSVRAGRSGGRHGLSHQREVVVDDRRGIAL